MIYTSSQKALKSASDGISPRQHANPLKTPPEAFSIDIISILYIELKIMEDASNEVAH